MLQRKSFISFGTTVSIGALAALAFLVGCSSSSGPEMTTAAAVSGPADMHCMMNGMAIAQSIGMCVTTTAAKSALSADGGDDATVDAAADGTGDTTVDGGAGDDTAVTADAGSSDDAGAGDDSAGADAGAGDDAGDNGGGGDYGPTLYNFEGDDDDCKYHVTWKSTAVTENVGVTFAVNVVRKIDGKPATGANIVIEAFLNPMHPTPTVDIPNVESAGGNYKVGPFVFDQAGQWTVRFHFYEMCSDEPEDSPHGHAAFFIKVP